MKILMKEKICQIITYGAFFDIPRGMFACVNDVLVELSCDFNDEKDEYNNFYRVLVMEEISCSEAYSGAFFYYYKKCNKIPLGEIKVSEIIFDQSKRKSFQCEILLKMIDVYKNINPR